MSDSRDRTAHEREAARRERELRRAQRSGEDGPVAPPPAPVSPPAAPAPPPPAPPPAFAPAAELLHEQPEIGSDDEDAEVPSGTRRVRRRPSGSPHRPHARRARRVPDAARRHSRSGRLFAGLALLLAAAVIWFIVELLQPFHGSGRGNVTITIPAHTSTSGIGDLLAHDGVVSSGFFFELRALLAGERGDLRAGTYHLKLGMSYGAALKVLTRVPPAARVTNLTIIEGRNRREISTLLQSQQVSGSYLVATRHSPLLNPSHYGAPRDTRMLEGFLFPSTYQLREPISIAALVADQLQTFKQRFATVNLAYARSKHLTPYDVLIVASMIEAEANTVHDRPLVASVIYNRLRDRMPLQFDSTTRYATGNFYGPLTASQLRSRSPYNTRNHAGLPPTPIDNPGLASIEAAAHPARTNYLYFVLKACGNGAMAFTSSYTRFLKNVHQFQADGERGRRCRR